MAIHLHEKWNPTMVKGFTRGSILASRLTNQFKWDGVRAIIISSPVTVAPHDYNRNGGNDRFGTINDVQDTAQRMEVTQDKCWILSIDAGNASEQQKEKKAAEIMVAQTNEQDIPYAEKHAFKKIAHYAGKIVGNTTALTAANITTRISAGLSYQNGKSVNSENRTIYIATSYYKLLKQNSDWLGIESLGKKALAKGVVGEFDGASVKNIPDRYMPNGVYFFIKWKGSTVDPVKLAQYDILKKVKGYSGPVVQGVTYYDSFVLGAKGDGMAVCGNSTAILAAPVIAIASNAATITAVSGVVFKYTTDGSNPRYSDTAAVYTSAVTLTAGQTIRAVGTKEGAVGIEAAKTNE